MARRGLCLDGVMVLSEGVLSRVRLFTCKISIGYMILFFYTVNLRILV